MRYGLRADFKFTGTWVQIKILLSDFREMVESFLYAIDELNVCGTAFFLFELTLRDLFDDIFSNERWMCLFSFDLKLCEFSWRDGLDDIFEVSDEMC